MCAAFFYIPIYHFKYQVTTLKGLDVKAICPGMAN
jgi:hypothetical protein